MFRPVQTCNESMCRIGGFPASEVQSQMQRTGTVSPLTHFYTEQQAKKVASDYKSDASYLALSPIAAGVGSSTHSAGAGGMASAAVVPAGAQARPILNTVQGMDRKVEATDEQSSTSSTSGSTVLSNSNSGTSVQGLNPPRRPASLLSHDPTKTHNVTGSPFASVPAVSGRGRQDFHVQQPEMSSQLVRHVQSMYHAIADAARGPTANAWAATNFLMYMPHRTGSVVPVRVHFEFVRSTSKLSTAFSAIRIRPEVLPNLVSPLVQDRLGPLGVHSTPFSFFISSQAAAFDRSVIKNNCKPSTSMCLSSTGDRRQLLKALVMTTNSNSKVCGQDMGFELYGSTHSSARSGVVAEQRKRRRALSQPPPCKCLAHCTCVADHAQAAEACALATRDDSHALQKLPSFARAQAIHALVGSPMPRGEGVQTQLPRPRPAPAIATACLNPSLQQQSGSGSDRDPGTGLHTAPAAPAAQVDLRAAPQQDLQRTGGHKRPRPV